MSMTIVNPSFCWICKLPVPLLGGLGRVFLVFTDSKRPLIIQLVEHILFKIIDTPHPEFILFISVFVQVRAKVGLHL